MSTANSKNLECLAEIKDKINQIITEENAQQIYDLLADNGFDDGGWVNYWAAKKMLNIDVTSHFYAEDNLGCFEELDGNGMLKWLEIAAFGDITYKIEGCYERMDSYTIDHNSEKYLDYKNKLCVNVVEEFIGDPTNKRFLQGPVELLPQISNQLESLINNDNFIEYGEPFQMKQF